MDHLVDPNISDEGEQQARKFNTTHSNESPPALQHHLTHVLTSPIQRAIFTSLFAFRAFQQRGLEIIALPELQTMGTRSNGTGRDVFELSVYPGVLKNNNLSMDTQTFLSRGWNSKQTGQWHADQVSWRIGFLKGFLKGIWLGAGKAGIEVAVVTHSSLLDEFGGKIHPSLFATASDNASIRSGSGYHDLCFQRRRWV